MKDISKEEIRKEMKEYYNKLEYLYGKANTKSKLRSLINTIGSLENLCDENAFDLGKMTDTNFNDGLSIESKFFDYIGDVYFYLDFLKNLSLKTIYTYKRNNYPYYKKYDRVDYIPFSTIFDLVREFYLSFNDESINRFMKNMSSNDFYIASFSRESAGTLYDLSIFKKYVIHINSKYPQNLYFVTSIVHEMGHAYEVQQFYDVSGTYLTHKGTDTIFYEVVSSFFEYAFINFLKENHYYHGVINHEFDTFYLRILNDAFNTYAISINGIDNMDDYLNIKLDNKMEMDKVDNLKEKINYYENLPNYGDVLALRDSILYFIGKLMAVNLYDKYKNDPKGFMKNFRTSLINYPRSGTIDAFEEVGITKDELLSGKVLRKELNKFIKDK